MVKIHPEELLQNGLHFGHKAQRVNPRAYKYIYKIENGISIIDLFKTAEELEKAITFIKSLKKDGKKLLVVGTKKQARGIVAKICKEHGVNFLTSKWIGGFLTNFEEIKKNIRKMETMKQDKESGTWNKFPKHERFKLEKQLQRVARNYEGVGNLTEVPDALFIIDIKHEANAVKEAKEKNIITVGISDTNADPYSINYPIPANDDALSSIEYVTKMIVEAYAESKGESKVEVKAEAKEEPKEEEKVESKKK